MRTASLSLETIRLDGGTQCRAELSQDYIAGMAEAWSDGAKIPAVVVFHDGSAYWLADGFHRYHAAQKCDFRDIEAEIHSGTRTDAVRYALGANSAHGQPRTNADKRRAVEIALKEFPKLSSREIAKVCAVSPAFIDKVRPIELPTVGSSETRTGADGKERKMPTKTPGMKMLESMGATIVDMRKPAEPEPSKPAPRDIVVPFVVPPQRSQSANQPRESTPYVPPARGLMMARGAISHLEEIPLKDSERMDGIRLVLAWCNSHLN